MSRTWRVLLGLVVAAMVVVPARGEPGEGSFAYDQFESPADCAECHGAIARQHEAGMMSQSFVHHWDEIEYFELALPHSLKDQNVAGIKAGCNGCHAPLAYLAGDIPPSRPSAGTRANEGVSCEVCHAITGFEGDVPFNFNWTIEPGEVKQGTRAGVESDYHEIAVNDFLGTAEFCGTCHNEMDPFGQWVKATHLEWLESPQGKGGIVCQDCHMPAGRGQLTDDGPVFDDVRQHLFHGAHSESKLRGSVEVVLLPETASVRRGAQLRLDATVVNAKAGHMIPTGSAEERVVWLHVEAVDAAGNVHHLPVDPKGFAQEDFTIASASALAYQDIGDIKGLTDFKGLKRDGQVSPGDRIFRLPYLDPQGRMTIAQWNTASFGPDYRLPPLEAVPETFTWAVPETVPVGEVVIAATVYYSKLVSSVAEFLGIPAEEAEPVEICRELVRITIS
ncbi:hypothetical protein K8I85_10930 [bacterium]|nr:hypothetical protein [bacterium]